MSESSVASSTVSVNGVGPSASQVGAAGEPAAPPRVPQQNPAWQPACQPNLTAGLLTVAPVIPFAALVCIVALYLMPPLVVQVPLPVLTGIAVALLGGLVAGLVVRYVLGTTSAESANASEFSALLQRIHEIDARLATIDGLALEPDSQTAHARAHVLRNQIQSEMEKPGTQWILGKGYVGMWRLVHRAEEALMVCESPNDLVAAALYDELRVNGSQISNGPDLLLKLHRAVAQINPAATMFLNQDKAASGDAPPTTDGHGDTQGAARAALSEVRHTVNMFRDDNWAGLAQLRNNIVVVMTATGVATLLLLSIVLSVRGPATAPVTLADPLLSASVFYLVGAIVGLFHRMYAESSAADGSVEDYGVTLARLTVTPVLSGLAGIGGVLLVALLLSGVTGLTPLVPSSAAAARTLPTLNEIFNLQLNQFGVVVAAIFAFTPQLIVSTLQGEAARYTSAIESTNAPVGSN
jgi:hypothetical protein